MSECRRDEPAAGHYKLLLSVGQKKAWQRPTLPPTCGSTIGAAGLNFRVRDGNGWDPCAVVTRHKQQGKEEKRGARRRAAACGLRRVCYEEQTIIWSSLTVD